MTACAHNLFHPIRLSSDTKCGQMAEKSFPPGHIADILTSQTRRCRRLSINAAFMIEKNIPPIDNHLSIIRPLDAFNPGPRANCSTIPISNLPFCRGESTSRQSTLRNFASAIGASATSLTRNCLNAPVSDLLSSRFSGRSPETGNPGRLQVPVAFSPPLVDLTNIQEGVECQT